MASGLDKHHILEAIDKLRSRKSRPDVQRIVSFVSKKYDFSKEDIKDYLEMLSKDGTVLKVEFKGSISYRNASKYRNSMSKTASPTSEEESSSKEESSLSEVIAGTIGTIAELIVKEGDYLDNGVSLNELYNNINDRCKKILSKSEYKKVLEKEVENGNLVKFENGNYTLGYPNGEPVPNTPNLSEMSDSSNDGSKEKSKSPVNSIRKSNPASRLSSPASSKNSSTSSLNMSEKASKLVKPTRTYTKTKKVKAKTEEVTETKDEENNKNESPIREGSRRKRFQKIVFDPSENPKPKKLKEKESTVMQQPVKKVRGPYKKHPKGEAESSAEKSKKDGTPSSKTVHSPPKTNPVIKEEIEIKSEEVSEDEGESDLSQKRTNCKICLFNIELKSPRASERYISCHVCDKKAHVSCIEDTEHWTRFKMSKWQCNDCKSCVACKGNKESNDVGLILCGLCYDPYHIKCANIKKSKTTQKWFCNKCAGAFDDEIKTEKEEFESVEATSNDDSSQRTTPEPIEEKKTPEKESNGKALRKKSNESKDIDESIPDCSNWTSQEVYLYFLKYVLPEEATVFRDQEIDGKVLLLLTRYDVLCDFKLKLGPALKIYAQVKKLQVRKSDPEIFWP